MTVIRGARERARLEITAAIKEEARRQLAAQGAAKLSLRAVARELGMVSSALYRYFPSRDDLLTALIVDAYDAVGQAAERALADPAGRTDPPARLVAVCRAVRGWALDHPHEYGLIYGSPVPGYAAPQDTVGPASRVGLALIAVVRDARADGLLGPPPAPCDGPPPAALREDLAALRNRLGEAATGPWPPSQGGPDEPGEVLGDALIAAWAQLFGLIGFEVHGQFHQVVSAREAFFDRAVRRLGHGLGLRAPAAPRPGHVGAG